MQASQACFTLIRRFEGLRLKAYRCPSGLWSCGYGHTAGVSVSTACTQEQAETWLREDVEAAARTVTTRFRPSPQRHVLSQGQFDALCSFVFNIGADRFREVRCTLLRLLNRGEPAGQVAEQFGRWVYGRDLQTGRPVKLAGLVARRQAERDLFLTADERGV